MSPHVGHPLPAFSLQDDQGATVTAKDLQGRWTVLYAYPKDSTPGCTTEACDFRDNLARVLSLGAQVYGISRDSLKSHQNFIAKQSLPFRLLSDPDLALLKPLGAFGKKVMYGKEVEGIISQLIREGFLNEARFAEHFAVSKFRQKFTAKLKR